MASTNHTTNYSLSQFVGSDKPAWLGDYNQDMDKIDTQMKVNADAVSTVSTTVSGHTTAISGLTSDVSALQTTVAGHTSDISALDTTVSGHTTDISSLQSTVETHTTQIGTNATDIDALESRATTDEGLISTNTTNISANTTEIGNVKTNLNNFEKKFNLDDITTYTVSTWNADEGTLTLAQSEDGSIFKLYGIAKYHNTSGSTVAKTKVAIPGLTSRYGFKTSLQLNSAPEEAYTVAGAGIQYNMDGVGTISGLWSTVFSVGTDGYIYLATSASNTQSLANNASQTNIFNASIYFNADFGDEPTPQA